MTHFPQSDGTTKIKQGYILKNRPTDYTIILKIKTHTFKKKVDLIFLLERHNKTQCWWFVGLEAASSANCGLY